MISRPITAKGLLIPPSGVWTTIAPARVAKWLMEVPHASATLGIRERAVMWLALLVESGFAIIMLLVLMEPPVIAYRSGQEMPTAL